MLSAPPSLAAPAKPRIPSGSTGVSSSSASSSRAHSSSEQTYGKDPRPSPASTPRTPRDASASHETLPVVGPPSAVPVVASDNACTEARYRRRQIHARHDIWRVLDALRLRTDAVLAHSAGGDLANTAEQPTLPDISPEARQLVARAEPHLPFALAWPSLESVHQLRERRDLRGPPAHLQACAGRVIAVAGQIGAGKSTACASLEKLFLRAGMSVIVLPEEIPHELLGRFIAHAASGPSRASCTDLGFIPNPYAFPLQMWMLEQCIKRAQRAVDFARRGLVVIADRCLHENIAFSRLQYESGNLTNEQWGIYLTRMRAATLVLPPPDLILLLDVPPELALARCQARSRPGEGGYELSYFLALAREYEFVFRDCGPIPLVRVDWSADHPIDVDSKCIVGGVTAELARIVSAALCASSASEEVAGRAAGDVGSSIPVSTTVTGAAALPLSSPTSTYAPTTPSATAVDTISARARPTTGTVTTTTTMAPTQPPSDNSTGCSLQ